MPRISAPTLAEHRDRRRSALLGAARAILQQEGITGLTFPAVARRAGLARTSLYEYFDSRAELVAAVVSEDFPVFVEGLKAAVAAAPSDRSKLEVYVTHQLQAMADGNHRLLAEAAQIELPPSTRQLIRELHTDLATIVVDALRRLNAPHPRLAADYIQAVVQAATVQIERGAEPEVIIPAACQFALAAVQDDGR